MRPNKAAVLALGLAWAGAASAQPVPSRVSAALTSALGEVRPGERLLVWVYFRDKGPDPQRRLAAEGRRLITPRAFSRRAIRGGAGVVTLDDLPPHRAYVQAVAQTGVRLRHELRWFNAVSVEATADEVRALEALPFVARLDRVRGFRRGPEEPIVAGETGSPARSTSASAIDYGPSLGQLTQIGVPAVHELGLHGEGVVIAVFDGGFDSLAHEVFSSMSILARHDFVNGDEDVGDNGDVGEGSHGTETLSTLGGYKQGQLVGPAFAAHYVLAKTEDSTRETSVEEDNWAAAAEWAEALGADVISSSLGYLDFEDPSTSYTPAQLDGDTAISTRAADLAAEHGVVVVNSAGNSGFDPAHNTLGAPADGQLVIAAGAVDSGGGRASFSSVGPTPDGRIKPDVAAQGVGVRVARPGSVSAYAGASGTSFSCPLTAGVAALVLQAHPEYTVSQVIAVLHSTASQADRPDNLLGWGIVNALAAVQAPVPQP